jgi:hypothetical protein
MNLDKEAEARKKIKVRTYKNKIENRPSTRTHRYRAEITAGALKVYESRKIAELLLEGLDESDWKKKLIQENILKTKSPATAGRLSRLLRPRLEVFDKTLWSMIAEGSNKLANEACFVAAIKQSPLVGDFLLFVLHEKNKTGSYHFNGLLWDQYIEQCRDREPDTPVWSERTIKTLRSSTLQMFKQVGCIKDGKELKIQRIHFEPKLLKYLHARNEKYILRCIEAISC